MKPPRRKANKDIIGKDSEGRPIYSHTAKGSITIDFIDDKPKNYQRKRISLEDEKLTREWLQRIKFHSYLPNQEVDLMDDAFRNGILLCELL